MEFDGRNMQAKSCIFIYTVYVQIVGFIIWNIYCTEGTTLKNWLFLFNIIKEELYSQVYTTIIGASSLSGKNAGKDLILMQMFNIQNLYYT
jgi:hypothetical protein